MQPLVFVVDGNIASGKSTIISKLRTKLVLVKEPLDLWIESGIFEKYNQDRPRYAYTFQTYALVTRIQSAIAAYREHGDDAVYLFERSWFTDRIFAEANYKAGYFTDLEWRLYQDWYKTYEALVPFKVTSFLYLHTSARKCYARIQSRERATEELIPLSYLQLLEETHDAFFQNKNCLVVHNDEDNCFTPSATIDAYLESVIQAQRKESVDESSANPLEKDANTILQRARLCIPIFEDACKKHNPCKEEILGGLDFYRELEKSILNLVAEKPSSVSEATKTELLSYRQRLTCIMDSLA